MSRRALIILVSLLIVAFAAPAGAQSRRSKNPYYGKTTNQVLSDLTRSGNAYGAAHRDERSLMTHQFYGRRDDYGYQTTGRGIVGKQGQAAGQVAAAKQELQRRMQNISDPRVRSRISRRIADVERGMSRQDSRTRARVPYLNAGGARYKPSWKR
jgi:hypothetical protein